MRLAAQRLPNSQRHCSAAEGLSCHSQLARVWGAGEECAGGGLWGHVTIAKTEAPVLDVSSVTKFNALLSLPPSDPGSHFYAGCCGSCPLTPRSNVLKTIRIRSSLRWFLPNTEHHLGQSSDTPLSCIPQCCLVGRCKSPETYPASAASPIHRLTRAARSHSKPVLRDELETHRPVWTPWSGLVMAATDYTDEVAKAKRGQVLPNVT